MSLISFHRLLIAIAILFCLGYGAWELIAYFRGSGVRSLLLALIFAGAGIALGYYLRHLTRFLNLPPDRGESGGTKG